MAIDFPNSPTVGTVFTSAGRTWTWDGTAWRAQGTAYGPTGPTGPTGAASNVTGPTGPTGPTGASGVSFPTQTGNEGKYLQTDGTDVSWQEVTPNVHPMFIIGGI